MAGQSHHGQLPGFGLYQRLFRWGGLLKPESPVGSQCALPGLDEPAEISWDAVGIPSVKAATMADAFRIQGYLHGRLRGFQMDFFRRMPAGELAELLGPETLPYDTFMRRLNLRHWAEVSRNAWSQAAQEMVQAYSDGVNAAWRQGPPAAEYRFLKSSPRPWEPLDTSLLTYFLSWALNGIWTSKWAFDQLDRDHDAFAWLFADIPGTPDTTIIPGTGKPSSWGGLGIGSNNWVVSGSRTKDGFPLLANDPHLMPQLPSIWFQMALAGGDLDVQGVSLPGAPGIIIGQNRTIAWGVTNVEPDCQDLYRIHMENEQEYRLDGIITTLASRQEVFKVRGQADQVMTLEESHAGPIIHQESDGSRIAFNWTGLGPVTTVDALMGINLAQDWERFVQALELWTVPAQNFVYADRQGHIGFIIGGLVPTRPQGSILGCADGNTRASLWTGQVPWAEMPRLFDPPEGYIVTANNAVQGAASQPFMARNSLGYRAQRIIELIEATEKHQDQSLAAIQTDVLSEPLRQLAERLRQEPALPKSWRTPLESFDGTAHAGAVAPTLLYLWATAAVPDAVKDALSQPFFPGMVPGTPGTHPYPENFWGLLGERLLPLVLAHYDHLDHHTAFQTAEARGREAFGQDISQWTWGRAHQTTLFHPFIQVKAVRPVFGRQPLATPGDFYTPYQAAFPVDPALAWPRSIAYQPSYRQILHVQDPSQSRFMHLTGQSGHPLSNHYDDLIHPYLAGETRPIGPTHHITRCVPRP